VAEAVEFAQRKGFVVGVARARAVMAAALAQAMYLTLGRRND